MDSAMTVEAANAGDQKEMTNKGSAEALEKIFCCLSWFN
jgi:hypothetical protein